MVGFFIFLFIVCVRYLMLQFSLCFLESKTDMFFLLEISRTFVKLQSFTIQILHYIFFSYACTRHFQVIIMCLVVVFFLISCTRMLLLVEFCRVTLRKCQGIKFSPWFGCAIIPLFTCRRYVMTSKVRVTNRRKTHFCLLHSY
jgi:hypothetical protein